MQMHRAANNALIAHANQNSAKMQEAIGQIEASSHLVLSNQEKWPKAPKPTPTCCARLINAQLDRIVIQRR